MPEQDETQQRPVAVGDVFRYTGDGLYWLPGELYYVVHISNRYVTLRALDGGWAESSHDLWWYGMRDAGLDMRDYLSRHWVRETGPHYTRDQLSRWRRLLRFMRRTGVSAELLRRHGWGSERRRQYILSNGETYTTQLNIRNLGECRRCDAAGIVPFDESHAEVLAEDFHATSLCVSCYECVSCCRCIECQTCNRRRSADRTCGACSQCRLCCQCERCNRCNDVTEAACENCENCVSCCRCDSDVPRLRQNPIFWQAVEQVGNTSARFVASEIEVARASRGGRQVYKVVQKWGGSIVDDGSLPESGFEINTSPAAGDKYLEQIEEICGSLANADARVTGQCGCHVHVDARDLKCHDIRRLIRLYALWEPVLMAMVPASRRGNHYCQPCGRTLKRALQDCNDDESDLPEVVDEQLSRAVYDASKADAELRKGNKYDPARYQAMNLHSWYYRGTVECRLLEGTVDANTISCWGMLWARIVDSALACTDEYVRAIEKSAGEPFTHDCPKCRGRGRVSCGTCDDDQCLICRCCHGDGTIEESPADLTAYTSFMKTIVKGDSRLVAFVQARILAHSDNQNLLSIVNVATSESEAA